MGDQVLAVPLVPSRQVCPIVSPLQKELAVRVVHKESLVVVPTNHHNVTKRGKVPMNDHRLVLKDGVVDVHKPTPFREVILDSWVTLQDPLDVVRVVTGQPHRQESLIDLVLKLPFTSVPSDTVVVQHHRHTGDVARPVWVVPVVQLGEVRDV